MWRGGQHQKREESAMAVRFFRGNGTTNEAATVRFFRMIGERVAQGTLSALWP